MLFIVIKTQFTATHCWPNCPHEDVSYLRNPHRHIFHVTMKWKVYHEDRDKEFIRYKNGVDNFIREKLEGRNLGSKSCEELACFLAKAFNADFVSVFEDNENGAEYVRD